MGLFHKELQIFICKNFHLLKRSHTNDSKNFRKKNFSQINQAYVIAYTEGSSINKYQKNFFFLHKRTCNPQW